MPDTLTIAAAARLCGCDRRTLQRAIHAGRLHLDAQHCLSRDALLAAGYLVIDTPQATPHITPQATPHITPQHEPQGTPQPPGLFLLLGRLTIALEGLWHEVQQLRTDLRQSPQGTPQEPPLQTPHYTPQSTPQVTPQVTPPIAPQCTPQPPRGPYDAAAAFARIRALRTDGLSLTQIAARLNAEGVPTRHGKPWQKGTVGYLLQMREA